MVLGDRGVYSRGEYAASLGRWGGVETVGDWLKRPLMLLDWYALGLGLVPLVYWVIRVSTRGDTLGLALRLGVGDRDRCESWDCPLFRVIGPGELPLRRMALWG